MNGTRRFLNLSLLLSASSLSLATVSVLIGRRVDTIHHLGLFNAMAMAMLAFGAGALAAGLIGTWRARGRSAPLWLADAVASSVVALYLFNP
jgi:hypothetical protein